MHNRLVFSNHCPFPQTLQVSGWAGPQSTSGSITAGGGRLGSDAAVLAAAAQRRRTAAYRLSSSSSSSDSEEAVAAAGDERPAPTEQELTAKLFAKLGIKQPHGHRAAGFESDSSWASSPERSRLIKADGQNSRGNSSTGAAAAGEAFAAAELAKAEATIVALQQELAAARAHADGTTQQLREVQQYAQGLEVRCAAAEPAGFLPSMALVCRWCVPPSICPTVCRAHGTACCCVALLGQTSINDPLSLLCAGPTRSL